MIANVRTLKNRWKLGVKMGGFCRQTIDPQVFCVATEGEKELDTLKCTETCVLCWTRRGYGVVASPFQGVMNQRDAHNTRDLYGWKM